MAEQTNPPTQPPIPQANAPARPGTVPLAPHRVPLHARVNEWKFQAKDKDGAIVEPSPGMAFFIARGPTSKKEMAEKATQLLDNARLDAMRAGLPDPGYVVDEESIVPAGNTPQTDQNVGTWHPSGAVPLSLPNSDVIAEHHQRLAEEAATGGAQ